MVALQLARRGVRCVVIDRASAAGRGIAYGTGDPAHLLNVPAGRMSAWPDAPGDFADAVSVEPERFAERRAYGDYLRGQLEAAVVGGAVTLVDGIVRALRYAAAPLLRVSGGWEVELEDGSAVHAETVVLATGNGRPAPFVIPGWPEERMVQDPWGAEAGERLRAVAEEGAPLLLVGTGLTMVDVVLTLERLGYGGEVTAVSRRGLVPRAHLSTGLETGSALAPAEIGDVPERLSDAVAWLRARGGKDDWRAAVDSLRPVSQALWAGWDAATRARFARHARPWWDVHRHRIAPEAAAVVERWRSEGRLRVMAGPSIRACGPTQDDPSIRPLRQAQEATQDERVLVRVRGGSEVMVRAALAVNCTGPAERLAGSDNGLLRQMLADGLIAPGELGLGVRVDDECCVLRDGPSTGSVPAQDERSGSLYAVGPLTRGRWWEITAVPDIRVQAERVAATIANQIG